MKKTLEVTVRTNKQIIREVEIEFPIYVKRSYPTYEGDTYIKYEVGETEYVDKITSFSVPRNSDSEYAMSYYSFDENNNGFGHSYGYKYALKKGPSSYKDYYEIINEEQYLFAFELYKTKFLNNI
jgi:hypothetical protein